MVPKCPSRVGERALLHTATSARRNLEREAIRHAVDPSSSVCSARAMRSGADNRWKQREQRECTETPSNHLEATHSV